VSKVPPVGGLLMNTKGAKTYAQKVVDIVVENDL
jgi:hypothetical protein